MTSGALLGMCNQVQFFFGVALGFGLGRSPLNFTNYYSSYIAAPRPLTRPLSRPLENEGSGYGVNGARVLPFLAREKLGFPKLGDVPLEGFHRPLELGTEGLSVGERET